MEISIKNFSGIYIYVEIIKGTGGVNLGLAGQKSIKIVNCLSIYTLITQKKINATKKLTVQDEIS